MTYTQQKVIMALAQVACHEDKSNTKVISMLQPYTCRRHSFSFVIMDDSMKNNYME